MHYIKKNILFILSSHTSHNLTQVSSVGCPVVHTAVMVKYYIAVVKMQSGALSLVEIRRDIEILPLILSLSP